MENGDFWPSVALLKFGIIYYIRQAFTPAKIDRGVNGKRESR